MMSLIPQSTHQVVLYILLYCKKSPLRYINVESHSFLSNNTLTIDINNQFIEACCLDNYPNYVDKSHFSVSYTIFCIKMFFA